MAGRVRLRLQMRKEVVQWHTLTHSLTFSIRVLDGERERERWKGERRTGAPGKPRMNTGTMRDAAAKVDVKGNNAGPGQAG